MPPRLMKPGIEFDFGGGQVLIVPPMSLGALEVMQDRLSAIPILAASDPEAIATIIDAAHHALARNYPELTRADVGELVDMGNMGDVYQCLMDAGGVRRRAIADEKAAAEGKAVSTASVDSAPSSLSSAPTPAGPPATSESS